MTDWKPIETAPKDGTRILGCEVFGPDDYEVFSCRFADWGEPLGEAWETEPWQRMHPTHWMPLPPSPLEQKTKPPPPGKAGLILPH